MIIYKKLLLTAFLSLTLAACGGGGGGSGSGASISNPCIIPQNLAQITALNAEDIVSEVKSATQIVLALANLNTTFIELLDVVLVNNPVTVSCDISGSATVNIIDNDQSGTISVGDLISANFINCVLMGGTASGVLEVTITTASGNGVGSLASLNDWSFVVESNIANLSVSDGNIAAIISGDANNSVRFDFSNLELRLTTQNNQLTFDGGNQCGSINNVEIMSRVSNVTTDPAAYTLVSNSGQPILVRSSQISGAVDVRPTNSQFSGAENLDDDADGEVDEFYPELDLPMGGTWLISGDNSFADVEVMPGDIVQILVDEDGDRQADATITTTWSAL